MPQQVRTDRKGRYGGYMSTLEDRLKYTFKDKNLLLLALSHKSYEYEKGSGTSGNNERLEFLGDAVVDLVLSELLMKQFPKDAEGALSKKRASLVNESTLSQVATEIELQNDLLLGKGEIQSGGQSKPRILASVYEALVGALFLDGGYEKTRDIIADHFSKLLPTIGDREAGADDFKTRLQEEVQAVLKTTPVYTMMKESGPPHDRSFQVEVSVNGIPIAQAEGRSKKQAEQEAAKNALTRWREQVK